MASRKTGKTAPRLEAASAGAGPDIRTWEGGYVVRRDAKGRDVYVIRRQVNGRRLTVSTRAHSLSAALKQLQRFEADPEGYNPAGVDPRQPLFLEDGLVQEYLRWSREVKKNSRDWVQKQKRYLAWWADHLDGLDLRAGSGPRRVSVSTHIEPALREAPYRSAPIAVLKAFYAWLPNEKHLLSANEDPTFETLTVPQARPEQWKKVKVIPREHYVRVRDHLAEHWRDGMDIQAATGWHTSELMRFAKSGSVEPYRGDDPEVAGVLVCPQTKNGEMLRTAVSAAALEPAKRILARGAFGREKYGMAVVAACKEANVPEFTPGRFRHSVATWAIERGADPASVAAFLNHKSPSTTRRFYATHAVPKKVPTLI